VDNILFIGNSFTARNNMPQLLVDLAAARGRDVRFDMIQAGGASLRMHWNKGEAVAACVFLAALFKENATGLASELQGVSAVERLALQKVAWTVGRKRG
jgi:hypothetical protein